MTLDEAREVYESMEGPGDETVRQVDWEADIKLLMDTVNAAVLAEREQCAQAALGEMLLENTGTAEDEAYNTACRHIADKIRSGE